MIKILFGTFLIGISLHAADIFDLVHALQSGSIEQFKSFVTTADDANTKREDNNKSILMYAVWVDNQEAVEHLLSFGAQVNAKDSQGATALLLAAVRNNTKIATFLIEHGADVNATTVDGMTPLEMSRIKENKNIEDIILQMRH
jgi:ankyrin repeat protein